MQSTVQTETVAQPKILLTTGPLSDAHHSASSIPIRAPLQTTGILDNQYAFEELTPAIGRLYPTLQLKDIIHNDKADELIRDLAITISRRGVAFFKSQDISPDDQKFLTNRLGQLTGKPSSSGLHIHPVYNSEREGKDSVIDEKGTKNTDLEISVISSNLFRSLGVAPRSGADEWHSDITFEPVPADYTSLKVHTMPETGGDTLWASGYETYDLLSKPFKKLLESLTGFFYPPDFVRSAKEHGYPLFAGPRGAAENVGTHLSAEHPLIRTNPVTGWKSIFGFGQHFHHVKDVPREESELVKKFVLDLVTQNHITQVRYRWGKNDLAIWDNRSTYHAATPDYFDLGPRSGVRAVSCGERPYFDPNSKSRREELQGRIN
ncbi:unnamed protein product [Malassezia sympodialis ATCC 42132]|uniref:Similar to S.cerevisiae protein JLP1 (Fe(II)-dependent sulfonate/alpha-ketoglutarate dioxygenase) n=1 Tax=Malassezia sympodialis (strain ATCC 42132) TaxID=1230383 RepID=M5E657_MALS4|nr:uncharacterized protein MSY001_0599 [Malassezia sympodialis ATCC 42132]CCU97893.1 unnamed protein product [Malassezia sympodialis ATCC 42132]SHO76560.1 Similar to S.cerevisiae protein JLP1 (Fe(II)-dependent sulfonate/alpha-ketoglutarate dioxygenase) [Malassezia sympodialis ATCC 42132]|eukprot:XP_018739220.1 uncharacterized protein MSY001_0599 [Malassezia sympodialis ATCC 42132]